MTTVFFSKWQQTLLITQTFEKNPRKIHRQKILQTNERQGLFIAVIKQEKLLNSYRKVGDISSPDLFLLTKIYGNDFQLKYTLRRRKNSTPNISTQLALINFHKNTLYSFIDSSHLLTRRTRIYELTDQRNNPSKTKIHLLKKAASYIYNQRSIHIKVSVVQA